MSQRWLVDFWLSQLTPFSELEEAWNRMRLEQEHDELGYNTLHSMCF